MNNTRTITIIAIVVMVGIAVALVMYQRSGPADPSLPMATADSSVFKDGVHLPSGLKQGEGLDLVLANCTNCHSAKLITQNRASREGWKSMIVWMQETQKLWDLGENEDKILDYLEEHYAPEFKGRRQPLENIEWYVLEED